MPNTFGERGKPKSNLGFWKRRPCGSFPAQKKAFQHKRWSFLFHMLLMQNIFLGESNKRLTQFAVITVEIVHTAASVSLCYLSIHVDISTCASVLTQVLVTARVDVWNRRRVHWINFLRSMFKIWTLGDSSFGKQQNRLRTPWPFHKKNHAMDSPNLQLGPAHSPCMHWHLGPGTPTVYEQLPPCSHGFGEQGLYTGITTVDKIRTEYISLKGSVDDQDRDDNNTTRVRRLTNENKNKQMNPVYGPKLQRTFTGHAQHCRS